LIEAVHFPMRPRRLHGAPMNTIRTMQTAPTGGAKR
jgi:hypothetical protein